MRNHQIFFPSYFEQNRKFKSVDVETKTFVNYSHDSNEIKDILLKINRPFLLYVKNGRVKLSTKDSVWYVHENDLVIVNRGNYIMSEDLSINNHFDALLFFLNDYFIDFLSKSLSPIATIFNSKIDVCKLTFNRSLRFYIESLSVLFEEQDEILLDEEFIRLKSKEFLHYLSKVNKMNVNSAKDVLKDENDKLKYTVEHKWKEHSIKELAFLCHMSISKFKRKFSEIYQTTPGVWIKEKKLQEAKEILLSSDISIIEVSELLGFKNSRYFSKVFKEKFKVCPREFRIL